MSRQTGFAHGGVGQAARDIDLDPDRRAFRADDGATGDLSAHRRSICRSYRGLCKMKNRSSN
ncbi:MAG: hypothetical protein JW934_01815 [Anaerolineae bacterium]|nr:hypothetical protein [Anaerolineae bacterium]